jgi:putative hydroxymethylpyrimidine transport system substrate-binding protein
VVRFLSALLIAGAVAVLLAGCGSDSDADTAKDGTRHRVLQSLEVVLDSWANPENVGLLTGDWVGDSAKAGLDLSISSPVVPARPVQYVDEGNVDVGVTNEPQIVLARAKGVPLTAIGSLVPKATIAMIWLRGAGIGGVADLAGKTIAIPGVPFQKDFLRVVLARAGLTLGDVKLIRADNKVAGALIAGRADAVFGGSANVEGAELEARGVDPVIVPASKLGIPDYDELVVFARPGELRRDADLYRGLMTTVASGTATAIESPEIATEAITELAFESNPKGTEAGVAETLPLLSRTGRIDLQRLGRLVDWMFERGLIDTKPSVSSLASNAYLASP